MRAHRDSRGVRATVFLATLAAAATVVAGATGAAPKPRSAADLRSANATLAARSRSAVLDLYSLESQLSRARAQLDALRAREAALERERTQVRAQRRITAHALRVEQQLLAARVRAVYERGDADPIAVILGAQSLDDAVDTLDELDRAAAQDRVLIGQTLDARRKLRKLDARLARDQAAVSASARAAAATALRLAGARAARVDLISSLTRQRRLNSAQIASLEAAARAAETKSATINASASVPNAAPASQPADAGTLTVSATGYSLSGRTSSGVPVGWGVVAVDPSVIPLGTHMTIPGYGAAVAADTGSGVRGAAIDLWFPTVAQARAWGRRVVTITLG